MRRYDNIEIQTRWDGKRVYKSTQYPVIVPQPSDFQVISNESDQLDDLAYKYYSDPTLYWIIARANNLGKGRMSITPGLTLRIPIDFNSIVNEFNRINKK